MNKIIMIIMAFMTLSGMKAKSQNAVNSAALQSTTAQQVNTAAQQKQEAAKTAVLTQYFAIRNSLVASDSVKTGKDAAAFILVLDKFKFKKLSLQEMNESTGLRAEIRKLAVEMSGTSNINAQRKNFLTISEKMWVIAKSLKPQGQILYQQVCPMTGATWLSKDKEIKNPYYPKNMLTCGEIKQSI